MNHLKTVFKNSWPIILISLLSFGLPLIWLQDGLPIAYAEPGFIYFLIEPLEYLKFHIYNWWTKKGLGISVLSPARNLYFVFTSFLSWLGLSGLERQYLVFSLILLSAGLASYFLALNILKNKPKKLAGLIACFYLLNPFVMNYFWHRFSCVIFGLPLFMLVVVKLKKTPGLRWSLFLGLVSLLASISASHMGYFLPLILPAFLYVILFFRKKSQWYYLAIGLVLSVIVNFWWLLSFIVNTSSQIAQAESISDSTQMFRILSQWTPLWTVFRHLNLATFVWHQVNYRPGWIEFLIPILALAGLLSKRKNKQFRFFSLLWVLSLYLCKGAQPSFGGVYGWLFKKTAFLHVFRNSQEKFGIVTVFAYSFLVSTGLIWLTSWFKNRWLKLGARLLVLGLLLGVSVWPVWTGDVFSHWAGAIPEGAQNVPENKVVIPDYWQGAADFINQDKGLYRILILPQVWLDYVWYDWPHGYVGGDFEAINLFFDQATISRYLDNPQSEKARGLMIDSLFQNKPFPWLGLLNIKYILVRNDVHPDGPARRPLDEIKTTLESLNKIKKMKTFGAVDIYQIDQTEFLPRLYLADELIFVDDWQNLAETSSSNYQPAYLDVAQQDKIQIANHPAEMDFRQLNPTKYYLKIKQTENSVFLVFNETFSSGWKAYLNPDIDLSLAQNQASIFWDKNFLETHTQEQTLEANHFLVNNYANGWYIDSEQLEKSNGQLIIEFEQQKWTYYGTIISIAGSFLVVVLLVFRWIKTKQ